MLATYLTDYCVVDDTPGQVLHRSVRSHHSLNANTATVGVSNKYFRKSRPRQSLSGKWGQERIGATLSKTIRESTTDCKINYLLKYFDLLCRAKQKADRIGLSLITGELKRVKEQCLFLESLDEQDCV